MPTKIYIDPFCSKLFKVINYKTSMQFTQGSLCTATTSPNIQNDVVPLQTNLIRTGKHDCIGILQSIFALEDALVRANLRLRITINVCAVQVSAMLAHQHLLKLSELKQKYSFKNDNNNANYL